MNVGGKRIGILGEEVAARHLIKHRYQIITRNYRQRVGEIDIIALDSHGELIFCEVKARTGLNFGFPAEAVGAYKQHKIIQTINHFRQENASLARRRYRFDVLAVMINLSKQEATIEHIKNAFI